MRTTAARRLSGEVPSWPSPTAGVFSDPFMSNACSGLPKICDAADGGKWWVGEGTGGI